MKRHLDKGSSYKIKDLVRGLITDSKGNSMIIMASNMLESRHAHSQGSDLHHKPRLAGRARNSALSFTFETLKPTLCDKPPIWSHLLQQGDTP